MNAWRFAGALLLGIAVSGCRTNISRDLLEQELRMQEDKIYELEGLVEEYQQQLDSCQRENQSLLKERPAPHAKSRRQRLDDEELRPPTVELPGGDPPPYDGPPVISPPDPNVPDGQRRDEFEAPPPSNARLPNAISVPGESNTELPQFEKPVEDEAPAEDNSADDKTAGDETVTQISLNRKLTGGHNVDDKPGDEGLMVVIEPLDASGQLIEAPGDVSVVVLDPAQEGEAARVARWDFTVDEAAEHIKRTPLGDGLHFDLRWPHGPPANRTLNVYVRFTTLEGKKLQLEKQIEVRLPGDSGTNDSAPAWTKIDQPLPGPDIASPDAASPPRAKATAIRPAPDDAEAESSDAAARKTERPKSERTGRSSGAKWTPYR
ncbi:MAG TPA: hypothetical protein VMV10_30800 [Pirellulales bacterium]|nr:hypothetical protein [Pirellulales bacterium]